MKPLLKLGVLLISIILSLPVGIKSQNYNWARSFGSSSVDAGISITTDNLGNTYSIGRFNDTVDFDPGPGITNLVSMCQITGDMYITKFDSLGKLVWAKRIGGANALIFPKSIAIDSRKNSYITGQFLNEIDFDPDPSLTATVNAQASWGFVLKLDSTGKYKWCNIFGDWGSSCVVNTVSTDKSGYIYFGGGFNTNNGQPIDFDPAPWPAIVTMTSSGTNNPFICKFDTAGNFVWVKGFIGPANTLAGGSAISIITSTLGNIFVAGFYKNNVDFDPGPGSYTINSPAFYSVNYNDIFISKLDLNGDFVWAKGIGGNFDDFPTQVFSDNLENVYTSGYFKDTVDFDPGPASFTIASAGLNDGFISKLDASGNFVWAKTINGSGQDYCNSFVFDNTGNLIVTGSFNSGCDLDPGPGTNILNCIGQYDSYVLSLDQSGNANWVKQLQSITANAGCAANSISINRNNLYLTGSYAESVDYNPDSGIASYTSVNSSADAFILRLGQCNFPLDVLSPTVICTGQCATLTANGASNYTWSTTSNSPQIIVCPSITSTYIVSGDISSTCTQSNSLVVTINPCTGIKENKNEFDYVSVFPNPANNQVIIEFTNEQNFTKLEKLKIVDVLGKEIKTVSIQSKKQTIDISELKSGCYYLQLQNESGLKIAKKVIKE